MKKFIILILGFMFFNCSSDDNFNYSSDDNVENTFLSKHSGTKWSSYDYFYSKNYFLRFHNDTNTPYEYWEKYGYMDCYDYYYLLDINNMSNENTTIELAENSNYNLIINIYHNSDDQNETKITITFTHYGGSLLGVRRETFINGTSDSDKTWNYEKTSQDIDSFVMCE